MNASLLAVLALFSGASAPAPSRPRVLLLAEAAGAGCRTTRVDARTVEAALFSKDSERCPVARVATETVLLRELADALEQGHLSRQRGPAPAPGHRPEMDFTPILDRLVDTRLVVLEAREMQLDRDPEFVARLQEHRASRLRTMLQETVSKDVKPDRAEVERLYREAVRQWELSSVLFEKEDDAKAFGVALAVKGASFDALAKQAIADRKAKGSGKPETTSRKHMLPEVVAAAEKAKEGVPFGPLKVPAGWAFLRVDATRYPEGDAAARAEAEARSVARRQQEAVRKLYLSLQQRYAKVDEKLLRALDLEAKGEEGFKALLQDKRPLVTIAGDRPITVGDLAGEIAKKFFHGIKSPIDEHRVNVVKDEEFQKLLGARLFAREAAARKLASRPEYVRDVEAFERELTFAAFIEKAIVPDVKVTEQETMESYDAHKAELTAPEMLKLAGIAFPTPPEAQAALEKLRGGTDFAWLRSSAPGQLPPEQRSLQLEGRTLSVGSLPPGLAEAISGAKSGEYRLFSPRQGEHYVVKIEERVPPTTQPYAVAREDLAKRIFNEKVTRGIQEYAAKLRKAQRVDVLVTRVTL
jgi:parvulin-like peptidyl-prolyl isomerase